VKSAFSIIVKGPYLLKPGISEEFTIELEAPAHGLIIYPSSNTNWISCSPNEIVFDNYATKTKKF